MARIAFDLPDHLAARLAELAAASNSYNGTTHTPASFMREMAIDLVVAPELDAELARLRQQQSTDLTAARTAYRDRIVSGAQEPLA